MKKIISVLLVIITIAVNTFSALAFETTATADGNKLITLDKMTTVSDFLENEEYASAVIKNKDGNELEQSSYIPHGSFIVTEEETILIYLMKDVNLDGKTTAADARLTLRCSARLEKLSELQTVAADVNNDDKITAADARLILRVPVGPLVTPGN